MKNKVDIQQSQNAYLYRAIRKTNEKFGFYNYKIEDIVKCDGIATQPFLVTNKVKLVVKIDPETVPREIENLNILSKFIPEYIPEILYSDHEKGILVMPHYPWPTLEEIIVGKFPLKTKIEAMKLCFGVLNALYESSYIVGVTDPYDAYYKRIIERVHAWINSEELIRINNDIIIKPAELFKSKIIINDLNIGQSENIISELGANLNKFTCPYKVAIHGDPNFANFICEPQPPYRRKLIDWPNFSYSDPCIDIGKHFHWSNFYWMLYEYKNKDEDEIIKNFTLDIEKRASKIKINFAFSQALPQEIVEIPLKLFRNFAEIHDDNNWIIRAALGKVRADIGSLGVSQPHPFYKLILFLDGIVMLYKIMNIRKDKVSEKELLFNDFFFNKKIKNIKKTNKNNKKGK